jgi:hypothetical protein
LEASLHLPEQVLNEDSEVLGLRHFLSFLVHRHSNYLWRITALCQLSVHRRASEVAAHKFGWYGAVH